MTQDFLEIAKEAFARGHYSEALRLAREASTRTKLESDERNCLICECLQYQGELAEASRLSEASLKTGANATHTARYWGVLGRALLEQERREEAAEAFRKGVLAVKKSSDLATLATLQQLLLVALGQNLGAGLTPSVREAFHTAVRSGDARILAGFHIRLSRLEGQRGSFKVAEHHLSLAKSLLERTEDLALSGLYHVNKSCILGTTGDLAEARKSAELGATLAERAGHLRLFMAAAANVAHLMVTAGDLSIAESWLRRARKAASKLNVVGIEILESSASLALMRGDFAAATDFLAEARQDFERRDFRWATNSETYSLLTELYLHKKQGHRIEYERLLLMLRTVTDHQKDRHGNILVTLAEAEALFDGDKLREGTEKVATCIPRSFLHIVQSAELNRMAARSLWATGHRTAARRRLLRACSFALSKGSRLRWAEALREVRSIESRDDIDQAYSLEEQAIHADTKFLPLMGGPRLTWYQQLSERATIDADPLDGFDNAVAILEVIEDPELLGREALASVIALKIIERAALVVHGDSGLRIIASHGWTKSDVSNALKSIRDLDRIQLPRIGGKPCELIVVPKRDLRSLFAISGIRRLLEAAKAIESQQKDQQRLGSLWQPEIIVEEPDAVFSSPQMIELMQTARKVAVTTLPVLLMGDTGTGKEVLARAIHRASPRANKVFLPFNCSAVPRDMVESQLFGYRRGSFTGAHVDFPGIIRSAEGGTLFLDEVGELSMDVQPKLLRFLETNEVHPLGEGRPIKVDVRIIAATNADLDDLVQLKEFREDLYYRLNIVRFQMPQLRERREEIPPLAMHLLRRFQMDEKKHGIKFSDEVMEYLLLYNWPGNIRQLSNELRRMVAMVGSNETLMPEHLSPAIRATRRTVAVDPNAATPEPEPPPTETSNLTLKLDQPLPDAVHALERAMIEHAIARTEGHMEEAARLLGISRKGLFLKRRRWTSGDETSSNNAE